MAIDAGARSGGSTAAASQRGGPSLRINGLSQSLHGVNPRRLAYGVGTLWFSGLFYPRTLSGRRPRRLEFVPNDLWPGDSPRGADIMQGQYRFAGTTIQDPDPRWRPVGATSEWQAELHGFGWLRDLHAVGGDTPRVEARKLILDWIENHQRWRPLAWRPDVLGARIVSWLSHAEFLAAGADEAFIEQFLDSLARQTRHLRRVARFGLTGLQRLLALKGLVYASLCIPDERRRLPRWLTALAQEINGQILGDGGHVERSPSLHFTILRHIVELRGALRAAHAEVPDALQNAVDRMTPMVRFYRHGDGGLALFNDSNEEEGWLIDVILTQAEARGKPLESAPHSRFERVSTNRTVLVMDVGASARGLDWHAHAGILSFEMSVGKERLIVNCGAYAGANPEWRNAQRATAAHSTLTVENLNSAELLREGGMGQRPENVSLERKEAEGNVWIDASHDGYARALGVVHGRRLFMAANGGDLRGEDTLSGTGNHKFAVRFHLHPSVKASVVQDGATVLLRLPSGAGWRFRATGGVTSLQESVYLGVKGELKRSEQIVVSGATQEGDAQVKWAFTRLAKKSG